MEALPPNQSNKESIASSSKILSMLTSNGIVSDRLANMMNLSGIGINKGPQAPPPRDPGLAAAPPSLPAPLTVSTRVEWLTVSKGVGSLTVSKGLARG